MDFETRGGRESVIGKALPWVIVALFIGVSSLATARETSGKQVSVADLCKGKSSPDEFATQVHSQVLPHAGKRKELVSLLGQESSPCRSLLAGYLERVRAGKDKSPRDGQRFGVVSLAIEAGLPQAAQLVEEQLASPSGEEWLESLSQSQPEAYLAVMDRWVAQAARDIRKVGGLLPTGQGSYGAVSLGNGAAESAREVRLVSPLLVVRYLNELVKSGKPLGEQAISNLEALYAGTAPGYREVFLKPLKAVLASNSSAFIKAFRSEPVDAQFRLFPLLKEVGGSEVVRELMWLSQHHSDVRMRAMASRTLDEIVSL